MDRYGLIGGKLSHSFSASYFSEKFISEGIDASYANYELKSAGEILQLVNDIEGLHGLNVTIPFKIDVLPLMDQLHSSAVEACAVNTIKITTTTTGKVLTGFNTDSLAFEETLKPLLTTQHAKALILGTGGAASAVKAALQRLKMDYIMVSRASKADSISYSEIDKPLLQQYNVIINCTPSGMFPGIDRMPDLPMQFITSSNLVYDLIYNPAETLLLKKAKEAGATIKNGLDMLHRQAELAWEIWNDKSL